MTGLCQAIYQPQGASPWKEVINPSGVMINEAELREIVALVEPNGCLLLFDET